MTIDDIQLLPGEEDWDLLGDYNLLIRGELIHAWFLIWLRRAIVAEREVARLREALAAAEEDGRWQNEILER